MRKEQKKKSRGWIADIFDVLFEAGGVLLEIVLFIPRVIIRIVKDIP